MKILWKGFVSGWGLIKETVPVWLPALSIVVVGLLILWDGGSSCAG